MKTEYFFFSKNFNHKILNYILIISLLITINCNKKEIDTLEVTPNYIELDSEGGTDQIEIKTNADYWEINNPANSWLYLSQTSGYENTTVKLTASQNKEALREDTLTIYAGDAKPVIIIVSQKACNITYFLTVTYVTSGRLSKT